MVTLAYLAGEHRLVVLCFRLDSEVEGAQCLIINVRLAAVIVITKGFKCGTITVQIPSRGKGCSAWSR